MRGKEPTASNLILEISAIAEKLDKLGDHQLAEIGRVKESTERLLASMPDFESKVRAAKNAVGNVLQQRLTELQIVQHTLNAKAALVARICQAPSWPSYIPASILADYEECCTIQNLSPKASVMLARRCLQGMIRDFFHVCCDTLFAETDLIRSEVDEETWVLIDEVRRMGNVGAHPKHPYELVSVEPGDASKSIRLLERFFKEWYVDRHEREQQSNRPVVTIRMNAPDERPMPGRPLAAVR